MPKESSSPEQNKKENDVTKRRSNYNEYNNDYTNQDSKVEVEQENDFRDYNKDYNHDFWRKKENDKEAERNKSLIRDEIAEDTADRVYNREPKEKQKEELEQQKVVAAEKKLSEQRNNSKSEVPEMDEVTKKEVVDTLDLMSKTMEKTYLYLDGEDLERAHKANRDIKAFQEGVDSGKISLNEEQRKRFSAYRTHAKGLNIDSRKSAKSYVDFAYREFVPFIAAVAIGVGMALGAVSPAKGVGTLVDLDNNLNGGIMR